MLEQLFFIPHQKDSCTICFQLCSHRFSSQPTQEQHFLITSHIYSDILSCSDHLTPDILQGSDLHVPLLITPSCRWTLWYISYTWGLDLTDYSVAMSILNTDEPVIFQSTGLCPHLPLWSPNDTYKCLNTHQDSHKHQAYLCNSIYQCALTVVVLLHFTKCSKDSMQQSFTKELPGCF